MLRSTIILGCPQRQAQSKRLMPGLVVSVVARHASAAPNPNRSTATAATASAAGAGGEIYSHRQHGGWRWAATTVAVGMGCLSVGFVAGQSYDRFHNPPPRDHHQHDHVLPNGLPRTCCETDEDDPLEDKHLTAAQQQLHGKLQRIVGSENVLDGRAWDTNTLPFLKGARLGQGRALCIVSPRRLQDVVDAVQAIVDADCVVIPQGQNTGLTGGSVPRISSDSKDMRPAVVLSLKQLQGIFPLDGGKRMVCLAGTGLASLQQFLDAEFPTRESHSQLGSTFLNPTTAAGVAFGSGGTQVRKGPAYTDRALYLTVSTNKWHERIVQVHSTLGIRNMDDRVVDPHSPAVEQRSNTVVGRLDTWNRWIRDGYVRDMRYSSDEGLARSASDTTYGQRLCDRPSSKSKKDESGQVSRFNADTRGIAPNRSEGKVIILATVHDTFPKPQATKTFWISFDSLETALQFREKVCLDNPQDMPISVEYLNRDAYDVIDQAGRVLATTIQLVGTTSALVRSLWNWKLWIEALPFDGASLFVDRLLFRMNDLLPPTLPRQVLSLGRERDHHVSVTVGDFGNGEMDRFLRRMESFAQNGGAEKIQIVSCDKHAKSLTAFRFAAAPAFRTYCVGKNLQGVSVDYALPKNDGTMPELKQQETANRSSKANDFENFPDAATPMKRMRYSHFGCNVVHEDLAYAAGVDVHASKYALKHSVEDMGGKLPSEHGHGREYVGSQIAQDRWRAMDPLNVLNPGIGGLSSKFKYKEDS